MGPSDDENVIATEPAPRSVLRTVVPFLLWNEFGERLAFYGLSTNLIIYLTDVIGQSPSTAAININLFTGTCYLTPLLGAVLADTVWGRYKTILIFSWVYFAGLVLLTASSSWSSKSVAALYVALYTIALGTGGIKANNSTFGADQFDDQNPGDQAEKQSFFNWFYFSINVGSLIASTVVVYIQQNVSWTLGFALPAGAMLCAIAVFLAGNSRYKHVHPSGRSPLGQIIDVSQVAWNNRGRARRRDLQERGDEESEPLVPDDGDELDNVTRDEDIDIHHIKLYKWLDGALEYFSAEEVREVKLVYALLPVFMTTIFYWTIYTQMQTFFVVQGSLLDRKMGSGTFEIPAASLSVIDTAAIVGFIPVYDRLLNPLLRRLGRPLTTLKRIGYGLVICSWSMIAAAAVERKRLHAVHNGEPPPSIWWQIPQYMLVGTSEVFSSVGTMEFFYDNAPATMKSSASALQLLSVCIGSYLSSVLVVVMQWLSTLGGGQGFLPPDLDQGRLDLFFMFLAIFMGLNVYVFVRVCRHCY